MKPFIHLFKTPKNYYFYDVNKNESVRINQELFKYLNNKYDYYSDFKNDDQLEKQVENLKKEGYLSNNRVERFRHSAANELELSLERHMDMLILQLTQSCNLRCNYCNYTSNDGTNRLHNNKYRMSWEVAKRSIDYYRERSVDTGEITLNFYGGEPLLEFELLKKCVDYSNQVFRGKRRKFFITTNATLLDDEKAKYLNDNNFNVLISLDGSKETNDRNRKFINKRDSVFDAVITNIKNINQNYKKLFENLSINMVLDPSIPFIEYVKVFDEYELLRKIDISITIIDDSSLVNKNKVSPEFIEQYYYYEFLSYLYLMGKINLEGRHHFIGSFLGSLSENLNGLTRSTSLGEINAPSGPCLPGKQRLMVNAEGKLFPCERVSETIERNCLGNIEDGINLEKAHKLLNISKLNEINCKDCFAFRYCSLCAQSYECTSINKEHLIDKCNECRGNFHNKLFDIEILKEIRYDDLV